MSILLLRDALFCLHVYKYVYILLQIDSISINIVPKHAAFPDFVYASISTFMFRFRVAVISPRTRSRSNDYAAVLRRMKDRA